MPAREERFTDRHRHRWEASHVIEALSWISTALLILFMGMVPWLRHLVGNQGMPIIASNLWVLLWPIYFNIQLAGTSSRSPTKMGSWAFDNFLSLLGLVLGVILMVSPWFWTRGQEEWSIIKQCTVVSIMDLAWGLAFSQRIAFAGKEREETDRKD